MRRTSGGDIEGPEEHCDSEHRQDSCVARLDIEMPRYRGARSGDGDVSDANGKVEGGDEEG